MALCETYFEQVSWIFRGVTRLQLIDDMLPVIYKRQGAPFGEDYSGPHDLALLFLVFAIGVLVGKEPSNAQGEHFHQIARAAISLQPVLEKPSIVTIQALHLMSIYNAMSGSDLRSETSMEMTWSLITLAAHLSQTVRLSLCLVLCSDISCLQIGLRECTFLLFLLVFSQGSRS